MKEVHQELSTRFWSESPDVDCYKGRLGWTRWGGRGRVGVNSKEHRLGHGEFAIDMVVNQIVNFPAGYHGGAGGVTFADGHAQIHRWRSAELQAPQQTFERVKHEFAMVSPNNVDLVWLRAHATVRGP